MALKCMPFIIIVVGVKYRLPCESVKICDLESEGTELEHLSID